jgi:hypothetical protein
MPFLGHAYSRVREYTCDRYGMAASTDREHALDGLCILAAGKEHGPRVNRRALVGQRRDLETVWMKLGSWLFTHPSIAHRLAALEPSLGEARIRSPLALAGALGLVALFVGIPVASFMAVATGIAKLGSRIQQASATPQETQPAADVAEAGLRSLWQAADAYQTRHHALPPDADALYFHWYELNPGEDEPRDPYNGERFGYLLLQGQRYLLWSTGPDVKGEEDDIVWKGELSVGSAP